jgi:hypothetical protein
MLDEIKVHTIPHTSSTSLHGIYYIYLLFKAFAKGTLTILNAILSKI